MQTQTEPWLRGTLADLPAIPRALLHALELAKEDLQRWCGELSDSELCARPLDLAPVGFHLRHVARSIDRLLTYAEGGQLTAKQIALLSTELEQSGTRQELFGEVEAALSHAEQRVRAFSADDLEQPRKVGKKELPTTVGGLLVHIAEHTQRHVGQAIVTAKVVRKNPSFEPKEQAGPS